MEFVAKTEKELEKISKEVFDKISKKQPDSKSTATVVGLYGDLGSGKTTFTKYFSEQLGISMDKIISPTFIIQKRFSVLDKKQSFKNLYHLDVYRIEKVSEILQLDWKEIISNSQNIILIEWANLIEEILPNDTLKINFETLDEASRKITTNF